MFLNNSWFEIVSKEYYYESDIDITAHFYCKYNIKRQKTTSNLHRKRSSYSKKIFFCNTLRQWHYSKLQKYHIKFTYERNTIIGITTHIIHYENHRMLEYRKIERILKKT